MKKYAPYILILILVLVGLFGPAGKAEAESEYEQCVKTTPPDDGNLNPCKGKPGDPNLSDYAQCVATQVGNGESQTTAESQCAGMTGGPTSAGKSEFEIEIGRKQCGFFGLGGTMFPGCVLQVSFGLLYQLPAFILTQTAYFFNVMMSVTLSGELFKHPFVSQGWGIVRDLSNIFFILILLYIAIKIILGLGGSEVKKMIGSVIIIALLINFSMFFTQVIIDSSNILALVFYNKLQVNTKVNEKPREYASVGGEKDIAGGMVAAFDPTKTLSPDFFTQAKNTYPNGVLKVEEEVPASTLLALILIAGAIMIVATYALFVSGLSFLGRLIELWVLIIAAPFAFMSSTVPKLSGIERWGWEAWLKRVLAAAFMAPAFMFLLYLIFLLISADIFNTIVKPSTGTNDAAGMMKMILGVVLPTLVICTLLLKATKLAREGSGKYTDDVMKYGKMAGGLALAEQALVERELLWPTLSGQRNEKLKGNLVLEYLEM